MPRTVYIRTPDSSEDLLYVDVYQRSGDPAIPDTVTGNFALESDIEYEITLADDEYGLLNVHASE